MQYGNQSAMGDISGYYDRVGGLEIVDPRRGGYAGYNPAYYSADGLEIVDPYVGEVGRRRGRGHGGHSHHGGHHGGHAQHRPPQGPHGSVEQSPHGSIIRAQWSPLPAVVIASAGGGGTAQWRPQRIFRARRLILNSSVSGTTTTVQEFNIGAEPQFVNAGNVPLNAFNYAAVGTIFRGDTCEPGIDLTVVYATGSGGPEMVTGVLLGDSVTP